MPSITIGFQEKYVRVSSEDPLIIGRLRQRFRKMISHSEAACASFTAQGSGDRYLLEPGGQSFSTRHAFLHQLEYEILNALILAHPRYIWIHAGAAARQGRAVIVSGRSGCGKSTIVTGLCQRGWHYLSDDLLPIEPESRRIHPFLRSPWFRLPASSPLPQERIMELRKNDVNLDDCVVAAEPAELAMMVFPVYSHGDPLTATRLTGSPAVLDLSGNIVNFDAHGAGGLAFLAAIGQRVPAWRLEYSDRQQAIEWIDHIFKESLDPPRKSVA